MKKTSFALISIASFFLLNSFCKMMTDDFSPQFLTPTTSQNSVWANTPIPSNLEKLTTQEYVYLGKGKQVYAFLSKDGQHVLKLLKPPPVEFKVSFLGKTFRIGLSKIPFMKFFCIDFASQNYQALRNKEFRSYLNAITLLPEYTQIEYLHLANTEYLQKKIKIYDKIGVLHTIDLDTSCFLIQKKADLLYPKLLKLIKNHEEEKAKILLKNFVAFYLHLIDSNIVNPTTVEANIGCINDEILQIDVGRILRAKDLDLPPPPLSQLQNSTSHMKKWLLRHNARDLHEFLLLMEEEMVTSAKTKDSYKVEEKF